MRLAYPGGMARAYDVVAIEQKWQRHWEDEGTYQIDNDDPREKYYALCMYPYPSGRPTRATCATTPSATWPSATRPCSAGACSVPVRFDSFGLPAENAAIKTGTHPRTFTEARIEELKSSSSPRRRLRLAP